MLFKDRLKKAKPIVQSKPCPYHSRTKSRETMSRPNQVNFKPLKLKLTSKSSNPQNESLPSIIRHSKIKTDGDESESNNSLLFQHQFQKFGQNNFRFNYTRDEQIYSCDFRSKRQNPIQQEDVIRKAHKRVNEIYKDEYYNVRNELEIIKRIRQRHSILQQIEKDRKKLQQLLLVQKNNKQFKQDELDGNS